jgi:hypothetical protein
MLLVVLGKVWVWRWRWRWRGWGRIDVGERRRGLMVRISHRNNRDRNYINKKNSHLKDKLIIL